MDTIRTHGLSYALAWGIWSCMIPKAGLFLWHLKWWKQSTKDRLNGLLCGNFDENIDHLFYACNYLWWLVENCLKVASRRVADKRNLMETTTLINNLITKSQVWGLHWTLLASLSWLIWHERVTVGWSKINSHLWNKLNPQAMHSHGRCGLNETCFKKKHRLSRQDSTSQHWDATITVLTD